MVFSVDSESTTASNEAVGNIGEERPFIRAGYTSERAVPGWSLAVSLRPWPSTYRPDWSARPSHGGRRGTGAGRAEPVMEIPVCVLHKTRRTTSRA